jgi:hypothetical protein
MTRTRSIVGLITYIVMYLAITKPEREVRPDLGCSAIDDDKTNRLLT